MVKVFTVCSGIGGAELGLANSNFDNEEIEIIGYSEIDKYAAGIYQKHFPGHFNYGDITKINEEELPDFDLMIGGFPCFLGTEKVRTINGLVDIKDINVGDQVLTKNGYHSVKHVMVKHYNDKGNHLVLASKGKTFPIKCTKNHPFYVMHKNGKKEWIEARDIIPSEDYVLIPMSDFGNTNYVHTYEKGVNQTTSVECKKIIDDPDYWWCVGYYIGDGWYQKRRKRNGEWQKSSRITLAYNPKEFDYVYEKFSKFFNCYNVEDEHKIIFNNKEFYELVKYCGDNASEKCLPSFFDQLQYKDLKALIDGYIYADGCYYDDYFKGTSISKNLIADVYYALLKLYKDNPTIHYVKTLDTTIIEGRTVSQKNYWDIKMVYKKTRRNKTIIDNDGVWIRVDENNIIDIDDLVYNLEVEEEHNYTVNDVLVHNCQAFSIAGYRKGFDDTRGTIFFDIARIMKEKKPKYALFENVKGLLSHDKGNTFQVILNTLDELGYDVSWNVLNSKHFGVPQNRERIYLRCHLREDGEDLLPDIRININNKQNGNLIKKDVVNKVRKRVYEVPEKELKNLLISAKRSSKLTTKQIANNLNEPLTKVEHYFRRDSSFSIPNENIWFDLKKILQIDTDEFDKAITTFEVVDGVYDSSNRVYDDEGISPTITTDVGSLIYTHKGSRQGENVYSEDGIAPTITASGGNCGSRTFISKDAGDLIYTHKGKHQGSNIYSKDGISPTLTATDSKHPKYIQLNDASINKLNGSGPQGTRIYDSDGLAVTQAANGGGLGAKTGLYKIKQSNDKNDKEITDTNMKKVGNLYPSGHNHGNVYSEDGGSPTLTSRAGETYIRTNDNTKKSGNVCSDEESPALCTNKGEGLKVSTATKKGYDEVYPGDGIRLDHPGSSTGRGRTQKESTGALTCSTNWGTVDDDFRVRRLIPLECERLQAFPDYWTEKGIINDKEVDISDTQRYKCCGNAFTTSVITYILNSFYDYDQS